MTRPWIRCAGALLLVAAPWLAAHAQAAAGDATPAAAPPASARLRADGSRFALTLPDGRVLYSPDLVGATLRMRDGRPLRIDAVHEGQDLNGQPLWQHSLSTPDGQGGWTDICTPHSDGTRTAMLVPGRERPDGTVDEDPEAFAITCTSGAQGKCLRFGYRPWLTLPDGRSQRPTYNACIHMIRADYGGSGQPHTENGKTIDAYDDAGIQTPALLAAHDFEAGWAATGAVCVHHARVARNVTLAQLAERYPALQGRVGAVCTEDFARRHGALLFNRSDPAGAPPGAGGP